MADHIIAGNICLSRSLTDGEATALADRMREIAVKNNIWINTCGHFKGEDVKEKYPPDDYLQKGYIPFEITDSEQAYEANCILSGIWYSDGDYQIADLSASGLPDIQAFLMELIQQDAVANIFISLDLAHAYPSTAFTKCTIHAHTFCTTLMTLPNPYGIPTVECNIVKDDFLLPKTED